MPSRARPLAHEMRCHGLCVVLVVNFYKLAPIIDRGSIDRERSQGHCGDITLFFPKSNFYSVFQSEKQALTADFKSVITWFMGHVHTRHA